MRISSVRSLHHRKNQVSFVKLQILLTMMPNRKSNFSNDLNFKIILIGESGTGKSCLMNRYVKRNFTSLYQTTIGMLIIIKAPNSKARQCRLTTTILSRCRSGTLQASRVSDPSFVPSFETQMPFS